MLDDLMANHKLKGLNYNQLIDSLGEPNGSDKDSCEVYYDILVNYDVIDPVSGKEFIIKLNKDSIVSGFYIRNWKRK